jgi:hypothetical protein
MKTKKNKTFDCIAMKREAQKAIRAKVQGMTREEEAAFFHEGREEFGKEEKDHAGPPDNRRVFPESTGYQECQKTNTGEKHQISDH